MNPVPEAATTNFRKRPHAHEHAHVHVHVHAHVSRVAGLQHPRDPLVRSRPLSRVSDWSSAARRVKSASAQWHFHNESRGDGPLPSTRRPHTPSTTRGGDKRACCLSLALDSSTLYIHRSRPPAGAVQEGFVLSVHFFQYNVYEAVCVHRHGSQRV